MRIGTPTIVQRTNRHVLSADVSVSQRGLQYPGSIWFSIQGEASFLQADMADAFVVGLMASAMFLGEELRVEGPVSTRLAHGMETYQQVLNTWWPAVFKRVDVHYENLLDRKQDPRPDGVGCTFSGGLDSFHAVLQMLPENVKYPGFSITHAMMINGFDQLFDSERTGLAQHMHRIYSKLLKQWGVELLMIDSNLKAFRNVTLKRREQVHSYSSALAACAHALGGLYGRFGISGHATYAYNQLEPDGSHPALDPLMSSDQLQIIHTGTTHSRSRKTEILADYEEVRKSLRICFEGLWFDEKTGMPLNCCECEKCVRTMVALMIMDKLQEFSTFSRRRQPLSAYKNPEILFAIDDHHLVDLTEMAHRHGKDDWAAALDLAREKRRERGLES